MNLRLFLHGIQRIPVGTAIAHGNCQHFLAQFIRQLTGHQTPAPVHIDSTGLIHPGGVIQTQPVLNGHDAVLGGPRPTKTIERNKELKEHKNNTVLRSRITAKWDIAKCKISPFASAELYSRIDKWRGFEKLRSRVGASYKIDKDNSIELYYLFEKAGEKGKGNTHAIGIGYSIDL